IQAVVLNKVGSARHFKLTSEAVNRSTKAEVVGGLPLNKGMSVPERHLGLIPANALNNLPAVFKRITDFVEENIRVAKVLEIARRAPRLSTSKKILDAPTSDVSHHRLRIGVARDEAFSFYYPENLELLRNAGLNPVYFSPIHDRKLPENISGLYLAGGFPEDYASALSSNKPILSNVKNLVEDEMPVYAECGGLMYLTRSITDFEKREHRMVGSLKADTVMMPKLQALNYTKGKIVRDTPISRYGALVRGHEFHYSKIDYVARDAQFAYSLVRGKGIRNGKDGWLEHQVLASYMHLHFAFNPKFALTLANSCRRYSRS
ncbi:MAG: cobyrinate a,c-diamide synthase, partial [Candidatus Bathyarchaeia archaeon]